jgi:hypothetical protein
MSIEYTLISSASELPASWDEMAQNYFQQREFLSHTEKYNPCKQRYWLAEERGVVKAGAVLYTLRLDLLTFLRLKSPVKMHIAGIPCSVSCPGFIGEQKYIADLQNHIYEHQNGFVLFLNLTSENPTTHNAHGTTLPTLILKNRFAGWDEYLSALRSDYRRRLLQILHEETDITVETNPCSSFTDEMHQQYLSVYHKSKDKLEKLTCDFFRFLPEHFRLTVCKKKEKVIGWNITVFHNKTMCFFLGGLDYSQNKNNSTYLRLLANIVKDGIATGAEIIDLGQTAEIPKMRLGALPEKRYMEARHSSKIFNAILKSVQGMLSYKRQVPQVHVFREGLQ